MNVIVWMYLAVFVYLYYFILVGRWLIVALFISMAWLLCPPPDILRCHNFP